MPVAGQEQLNDKLAQLHAIKECSTGLKARQESIKADIKNILDRQHDPDNALSFLFIMVAST